MKRAPLKHRIVRWLDMLSRRLRPIETIDYEKPNSIKSIESIESIEISLVCRCPYCGTGDWDNPKTKPDGTICNHPTRLRVIK